MQNYKTSLAHYGIKGQKWGVRRFQNEDGTLTVEGRERYGSKKEREDKGLVRKTIGSEFGNYAFAKWRERRHNKNLAKAEARGDQKAIEKFQSKKDAQSAANANLDAYRKHHSAASLAAQNLLITAPAFRHARARGESVINSLIESHTPIGPILRMFRDKSAYGKYVVFGIDQNEKNDSKTGGKRENEVASKNGIEPRAGGLEPRTGSVTIKKNDKGQFELHTKDLDKKTRDRILDNYSPRELREMVSELKDDVIDNFKSKFKWDITKESFVKDISTKPLEEQLYFYAQFFNMEDYL